MKTTIRLMFVLFIGLFTNQAHAQCLTAFTANTAASPLISFNNTSIPTSAPATLIFNAWDFGDGSTSTAVNPSHIYNAIGTYNVCLIRTLRDSTTYAIVCTDTTCNTVAVTQINNYPCEALFWMYRDTLTPASLMYSFSSSPSFAGGGSITSYAWDFGDGNTSNVANPTHSYATPGQYNVCLTISTSNSCTDNYCLLINVQPSNILPMASYITGTVVPPPSLGAMVYLIEYNTTTQSLYAVASQPTLSWGSVQGAFSFGNINGGTYLVKAAYNAYDPAYATHLPTYYNSNALWSGATSVVTTPSASQNLTINMLAGTPTIGPGFIGGSVLTGANKTTAVGDPKHKLYVLLMDATTNQFIAVSRTDVNGDYSFSGVPNGTYKVFLEELGKTMTEAQIVISTAQTSYPNVDFESNSTENHPLWATSTSNITANESAYQLAQNPVSNEFSILGLSGKESVRIYDVSGKIVKTYLTVNESDKLNIAELSNGIYMLHINNNGMYQNLKMVISK